MGDFKVYGTSSIGEDGGELCEGCLVSKSSVKPFPKSTYGEMKTTVPREVMHSDIMGPMEKISQGVARYIVRFIDEFSRYTVAYFKSYKSEVVDRFTIYKALVEILMDFPIKYIRTDNGSEYINKRFAEICRKLKLSTKQLCRSYRSKMDWQSEGMNPQKG